MTKKVNTVISEGKATVQEVDWLLNSCRSDIETILGYKFKDPSLLLEVRTLEESVSQKLFRSLMMDGYPVFFISYDRCIAVD